MLLNLWQLLQRRYRLNKKYSTCNVSVTVPLEITCTYFTEYGYVLFPCKNFIYIC